MENNIASDTMEKNTLKRNCDHKLGGHYCKLERLRLDTETEHNSADTITISKRRPEAAREL